MTDEEMRYQRPQTTHQTSGGRRSHWGKWEGNRPHVLSPLGVAKGPREEGADRKHGQAELGKEEGGLKLVTQF